MTLYCPWELMTCQTSCVLSAGILCSEYWLKYCAAAIKKNGPWQAKSSFWPVRCVFSVRPEVIQGWQESRCKAARKGHTLRSRKINKVKSNETGGWKPPDTNLFLTVYAHFFTIVSGVLSLFSYFLLSLPLPHVSSWQKEVCVHACMYVWMLQKLTCCLLCLRCTQGKYYTVLFSVDTSVLSKTTLKMEYFTVFCVCVYLWV